MCGLEEGLLQPPRYSSVAQSWTVPSIELRCESISCTRFLHSSLKTSLDWSLPIFRSYLFDRDMIMVSYFLVFDDTIGREKLWFLLFLFPLFSFLRSSFPKSPAQLANNQASIAYHLSIAKRTSSLGHVIISYKSIPLDSNLLSTPVQAMFKLRIISIQIHQREKHLPLHLFPRAFSNCLFLCPAPHLTPGDPVPFCAFGGFHWLCHTHISIHIPQIHYTHHPPFS